MDLFGISMDFHKTPMVFFKFPIDFLVVLKNGKMVEQSVGLKDENTILEMIRRHENTQV